MFFKVPKVLFLLLNSLRLDRKKMCHFSSNSFALIYSTFNVTSFNFLSSTNSSSFFTVLGSSHYPGVQIAIFLFCLVIVKFGIYASKLVTPNMHFASSICKSFWNKIILLNLLIQILKLPAVLFLLKYEASLFSFWRKIKTHQNFRSSFNNFKSVARHFLHKLFIVFTDGFPSVFHLFVFG